MCNLSLNELKLVSKSRGIKGYNTKTCLRKNYEVNQNQQKVRMILIMED